MHKHTWPYNRKKKLKPKIREIFNHVSQNVGSSTWEYFDEDTKCSPIEEYTHIQKNSYQKDFKKSKERWQSIKTYLNTQTHMGEEEKEEW